MTVVLLGDGVFCLIDKALQAAMRSEVAGLRRQGTSKEENTVKPNRFGGHEEGASSTTVSH